MIPCHIGYNMVEKRPSPYPSINYCWVLTTVERLAISIYHSEGWAINMMRQ